jgi:two-component system nitrogen regulation response regulator GlnG
MAAVLVVDGDPAILHLFRWSIQDEQVEILSAQTINEAVGIIESAKPDALFVDLGSGDGLDVGALQRLKSHDPGLPIVVLTAKRSSETAIQAMRFGAFDYIVKPLSTPKLQSILQRAFELRRISQVPVGNRDETQSESTPGDRLVGSSPAMQEVYKAIGRVADQDVTVLILGESGTGKELVARAIYQHSRRAGKPFVAVNCAAIPDFLLESELFGHERGSFTGAERQRIGRFEQCNGGTLFLDEIGDMAPVLQSKILRILQERQFERVGGSETIHADVRIIAATNRRLDHMVEAGTFRADLFYRLNVFTISLPPLRDRQEDLPILLDFYLRRYNRELGREVHGVAPDALETLLRYSWPGNVRELQSVLKQSLLHAHGPILTFDCLPASVQLAPGLNDGGSSSPLAEPPPLVGLDEVIRRRLEEGTAHLYEEVLNVAERHLLTRVLQHTGGNQVQAARILGIARGSLRKKVRTLKIRIGRHVQLEDDLDLESP